MPYRLCVRIPLIVLVVLLLTPCIFAAADQLQPRPQDRYIVRVVVELMRRQHVSQHPLDDEISQRTFDLFLKSLDPQKIYLSQVDVDEFLPQRNELDDELARGDVSFAYRIYARLLERIDERVKLLEELVAQNHDFTIDEEMATDPDVVRYAQSDAESIERWRKRIKYDLLVLKVDGVAEDEASRLLLRRYQSYAQRLRQIGENGLLEVALSAMTNAFDPDSTYMLPAALENYRIDIGLKLEGIGAALQMSDGDLTVSRVLPGTAADKHGKLKSGDRIVGIGQGPEGEMVDVRGKALNDIVKLIRGKRGTVVRLAVVPEGQDDTQVHTITRGNIDLKDSQASGRVVEHGDQDDNLDQRVVTKIGVIRLPQIYFDTEAARQGQVNFRSVTRDVRKILNEFRTEAVEGVVLDLRHTKGDSLTEAINLAGLFVDQGPVVQVKNAQGQVQQYDDLQAGMVWDGPLVVVTSRQTMGSAEILAAAIQDYRRGIIVGDEATNGKGTIQSLLILGDHLYPGMPNPPQLGALQLTTQQAFRLTGESIQLRGVAADVALPSLSGQMKIGQQHLDYALPFNKVPAADYQRLDGPSDELLDTLRQKSQTRRDKSEDFAKVLESITRYRQQRDRTSVTLNEEQYIAQRNRPEEGEKTVDVAEENQEQDDFYMEEVLQLTADYLENLAR